MIRFLSRRVLFILLVCLCIIFFVHLGMLMVSNSTVSNPDFDIAQKSVAAWRDSASYIRAGLSGELGSIQGPGGPELIIHIVKDAYKNSMGLLLVALTAATILGCLVGGFLALTHMKNIVVPVLTLTVIGISTPSFFAAILLQQGEIQYLRTFGYQLVVLGGYAWDFKHMLLPLLVLTARPLAYITRATYLNLDRIMNAEYIRTAHAKGLTHQRTVNIHAMRNLLIPVITAIVVSLRFSLGILPIVEIFFRWPGMGYQLIRAIDARHTALAVSLALVLGITLLLANLLLDVIYRFLDPRLRDSTI